MSLFDSNSGERQELWEDSVGEIAAQGICTHVVCAITSLFSAQGVV